MRTITLIVIHCSAVRPDQTSSAEQIDSWHKSRGWKGIGYHYVVYLDGSIHAGRPESAIGAHCTGHNRNSLGVCYVGGMTADMRHAKDTRTPEQKKALLQLLRQLKKRYPGAKIYGHRNFAAKACPSFDAREEYKSL